MNLEGGLRRIVLTISFAAAGAGLVVTGYDIYKTTRYVRATNELVACSEESERWTPTMEDFKMLPDTDRPVSTVVAKIGDVEYGPPSGPPDEKMSDAERFRWTRAARNYRRSMRCGYILIGLPAHLDHAIDLWDRTDWLPLWATSPSNQSYTLALLPLIWGVLISTALGLLPWGMFYLLRWLVQGFTD